jgi:hypothetical protein
LYNGKYQNQPDKPTGAITNTDGPVKIFDEKGVYPENLDPIIEKQK